MKKKLFFLCIIGIQSSLICSSSLFSTTIAIQNFGHKNMPGDYWDKPGNGFSTFKQAILLAKVNALSVGLEKPEGVVGAQSFCSAFIHALTHLKKVEKNSLVQEMIDSYRSFLDSGDDEGVALQIFAQELSEHIRAFGIRDISFYNAWIQEHKKPEIVEQIVSYSDSYGLHKNKRYVKNLFDYVSEKIEDELVFQG